MVWPAWPTWVLSNHDVVRHASRLGFDTAVLTPRPHAPDARVSAHSIVAPYTDDQALAALAS